MDLNAYLAAARDEHGAGLDGSPYPITPRIECADGFSLSVQANSGAYCSPRSNMGPWREVEVGFPSAPPEYIMERAEDPDTPTETVYSYVPVYLVEQLIHLHGGPKLLGAEPC